MDKMHAELTTATNNLDYSPALQAALTLGKNLLDKYYSLSDDSEVYRIAMGKWNMISFKLQSIFNLILPTYYLFLHPKHKLKYFKS